MNKNLAEEYIKVFQEFHKRHKNKLKLSIKGEAATLLYIHNNVNTETITPSLISKELNITTARVAASLNSLEEKQLITREIDLIDRRKIMIRLTEEGKNYSKKLNIDHLSKFEFVLNKLGDSDSNELLRIVKKINVILEKGDYCA